MTISTKILQLSLLMVGASIAGWWLFNAKELTVQSEAEPAARRLREESATPNVDLTESPPTIVQPYARTPMLGLSDPRWNEYEIKKQADPSWQWKVPIRFFGKVIDEKNQPVESATIEVAWNGTPEKYGGDGVGHRTLTSKAGGLFELVNVEGKGISVRVSKDGYHVPRESNMQWFEFAGFWQPTYVEPDPNNPVVFRLVKRLKAEPTHRVYGRLILQPPDLEAKIDLLSPDLRASATTDLVIRFYRPADASYHKPFDWSINVEGKGGAEIVATEDEFMSQAPLDGYKSVLNKNYLNQPGNSRQMLSFFVRNKDRKLYAAVHFEMTAYRKMNGSEPASIIVTATVNPNNSRIVEYDPNQDLREVSKGAK